MKLRFENNSFLKQTTSQSRPEDTENFVAVDEGYECEITDVEWQVNENHYKVKLKERVNGIITWYVFVPHVVLLDENNQAVVLDRPEDTAPNVDRADLDEVREPSPVGNRGAIRVGSKTYALDSSIIPGGNFSWWEAMSKDMRRVSKVDEQDAATIIALAKALQPYREKAGVPFEITSWFRPEPFNRNVGGARRSQHIRGAAVDLKIEVNGSYLTGRQMYQRYFRSWKGGVGVYRHLPFIIHLDIGPKRTWGL